MRNSEFGIAEKLHQRGKIHPAEMVGGGRLHFRISFGKRRRRAKSRSDFCGAAKPQGRSDSYKKGRQLPPFCYYLNRWGCPPLVATLKRVLSDVFVIDVHYDFVHLIHMLFDFINKLELISRSDQIVLRIVSSEIYVTVKIVCQETDAALKSHKHS